MSVRIIPKMGPENLEKILEILPEPDLVEIELFGDFDYSDVSKQAEEITSGIKLKGGRVRYELEDISTEKILEIYRASKKYIPADRKGIELHKIQWFNYINSKLILKLTPYEVNIKYEGKEPDCISKLRNVLDENNIRYIVEVNK